MPFGLLLLAICLAANVLLGPLGIGAIQWHVSAIGINQTYGADAVSLVLVTPAALIAAGLWRGHHRLAAPVALGVGLVTLYYAVAETLGGDYVLTRAIASASSCSFWRSSFSVGSSLRELGARSIASHRGPHGG